MLQKRPPIQGLSYRFFTFIILRFKKQPVIINQNTTIENRAIFISNHSSASGPITLSVFFPKLFIPWGIHDMCENYPTRWRYLYYVFYQQKLHYGRARAFIMATLFGLVSPLFYHAMKVIPTYIDFRMSRTIRLSMDYLDSDYPILVFPEDSSTGYHEQLHSYHPGFVFLALQYYQRTKIDPPIYTVYFNKQKKALYIDRPIYIQSLIEQGMNKNEIANYFKEKTNLLRLQLEEALNEKKEIA